MNPLTAPRALLPVLALLTACTAVNDGAAVRELAPCAVVIAIDDVDAPPPGTPPAGHALAMTASTGELTTMLVRSLGDMRAASRVVRLADLKDRSEADIVLKPRLQHAPSFEHTGVAGTWWASMGLWLVTWIGGMAVNDSTYRTDMAMDCTVTFPQSEHETRHLASSSTVDATFLQRNRFFSWSTLQSLVLPPFWTSDDTAATRAELTRLSVESVAVDLARYLKREFERDARDKDNCSIAIAEPKNGSATGASTTVRGTIDAVETVTTVSYRLSGGDYRPATFAKAATAATTAGHAEFEFHFEVADLRAGDNLVQILVVAGDRYTRTVLLRR